MDREGEMGRRSAAHVPRTHTRTLQDGCGDVGAPMAFERASNLAHGNHSFDLQVQVFPTFLAPRSKERMVPRSGAVGTYLRTPYFRRRYDAESAIHKTVFCAFVRFRYRNHPLNPKGLAHFTLDNDLFS